MLREILYTRMVTAKKGCPFFLKHRHCPTPAISPLPFSAFPHAALKTDASWQWLLRSPVMVFVLNIITAFYENGFFCEIALIYRQPRSMSVIVV
jgi:hypothetical protein